MDRNGIDLVVRAIAMCGKYKSLFFFIVVLTTYALSKGWAAPGLSLALAQTQSQAGPGPVGSGQG